MRTSIIAIALHVRTGRFKLPSEIFEAVYHVMSRCIPELRLAEPEKEALRRLLWRVAEYCGIQVITYVIMDTHFHALVCVPKKGPISDAELVRRYCVLHPEEARRMGGLERALKANSPRGVEWREGQLRLMGDLSQFMKLLKQMFSKWYNGVHQRKGPFWRDRFKSVLVEQRGPAFMTTAAYIDLNSIRAGLCKDPKDYRYCGYAEAVAGNERARSGVMRAVGMGNWEDAQPAYRQLLFSKGARADEGEARISQEAFDRVVASGGKLPLATVLRCRIRYFNDGAVLGSRIFVQTHWPAYSEKRGSKRMDIGPLPPGITDWGEIFAMRTFKDAITVSGS